MIERILDGLFRDIDSLARRIGRLEAVEKPLRLTATATWDPANMAADGNVTSTTITVTGAALGDPVDASLTTIGANDVLITAHVQAADTVRVILQNKTGGALNIASGTLRVDVWRH